MVFLILKVEGGIIPVFVDGWAVVDTTSSDCWTPLIMTGFDSKIFKGLRKDDVMNIALNMRLDATKMNKKGSGFTDKTVEELKTTIEKGWGSFFKTVPRQPSSSATVPPSSSAVPPSSSASSSFEAAALPTFKTMFYHLDQNMYECTLCKVSWQKVEIAGESSIVKNSAKCQGCARTWCKWGVVTEDGKLYDFKGNYKSQLIDPPMKKLIDSPKPMVDLLGLFDEPTDTTPPEYKKLLDDRVTARENRAETAATIEVTIKDDDRSNGADTVPEVKWVKSDDEASDTNDTIEAKTQDEAASPDIHPKRITKGKVHMMKSAWKSLIPGIHVDSDQEEKKQEQEQEQPVRASVFDCDVAFDSFSILF